MLKQYSMLQCANRSASRCRYQKGQKNTGSKGRSRSVLCISRYVTWIIQQHFYRQALAAGLRLGKVLAEPS